MQASILLILDGIEIVLNPVYAKAQGPIYLRLEGNFIEVISNLYSKAASPIPIRLLGRVTELSFSTDEKAPPAIDFVPDLTV